MPSLISLDVEMFGPGKDEGLPKVGAIRWTKHPIAEILCACFQIDDGPVRLWVPGQKIPQDFIDAARDPSVKWSAWNAGFEIAAWINTWMRQSPDLPECPPPERWIDSMAVAAYFGLPQALDKAAKATGSYKMESGRRLINLLSMPCQPTAKFPHTRRTPETHPELFKELYDYCKQDVVAERAVHDFMPRQHLPPAEQRIWIENLKSNVKGVRVDIPLVGALTRIRDGFVDKATARFEEITGGLGPTQTIAFRHWLMDEHLVNLPNLQKGTIDGVLEAAELEPLVLEALTLRRQAAQVASKKLDAMIRYAGDSDRVHDMTVYYGASTGRFAGRGVQLQNLMRGVFKVNEDIDPGIFLESEYADIPLLYGTDPMSAVGTMIRPCIIADEGHLLFDADYSAIEARGVAWLSDCESMLTTFHGDGRVYEEMATEIFDCDMDAVDGDRRFVGKTGILGCGYGCGPDKFLEMCVDFGRDIGEELAKHTVKTYRSTYPEVPALWKMAENAFKSAIRNPGKVFRADPLGRVLVQLNGSFLFARLPSGRCITYCLPSIEMVEKTFNEEEGPQLIEQVMYMGIDSYTRRWQKISLYGGKIVENLVQGIARDLMCHGLMNTIDAGYDFLFTVHDQIISQRTAGSGDLGEYLSLMCDVPEWAEGFPLDADGKVCHRFSK